MSEVLRLENICKWAGSNEHRIDILQDITLSVQEGEYVAIMGPSGSGKSTLLNLLGLLDKPSSGSIYFNDKDVSQLSDEALSHERAQNIGFIFQSFNLLPYLTAVQNVEVALLYSGRWHETETAHTLLSQVGMSHRATSFPSTLSGGERQRIAIARALANHPKLLLADEPTGALDSKTGAHIMDLIKQLHQRGSTIVLITHDEAIARQAQRVLRLKDGHF